MNETTPGQPEEPPSRRVKLGASDRVTYVDKTGQRFGKLVVVRLAGLKPLKNGANLTNWLCRCDCGTELEVDTAHIARRAETGCGCGRRTTSKDKAGERFGPLVVIKRAGTKIRGDGDRVAEWLCRCDCGAEVIVDTGHLNQGKGHGCRKEHPQRGQFTRRLRQGYWPGLAARNNILKQYQWSAAHRGHAWELAGEEFDRLITANCHYCGRPPSKVRELDTSPSVFVFNGIDRKDNRLGYTTENAVACCIICNRAKSVMPYEEFIDWLEHIVCYRSELLPTSHPRQRKAAPVWNQGMLFSTRDTA